MLQSKALAAQDMRWRWGLNQILEIRMHPVSQIQAECVCVFITAGPITKLFAGWDP